MSDRIESAFRPAKDSVSWAEDAINEFRELIRGLLTPEISEPVREIDPQTGETVDKLRLKSGQMPLPWRRKATEALTNTKHAFDQVTFAARNLTSGFRKKSIYFPWSNHPTDLKRLLEERGINQRLWNVFEAHHPYPSGDTYAGGDNVIRTLAQMANDKHTVGLSIRPTFSFVAVPMTGGAYAKMCNPPRWDPVKNETEIVRWVGTTISEGEYRLQYEVIFEDARFSEPVNAFDSLSAFAGKAKTVIEDLERRCRELNV